MRIWDLSPAVLCRNHLLGEHRELHALWSVLMEDQDSGGYNRHPETCRWRGKRKALYDRHKQLVKEMQNRGYNHNSPLEESDATGQAEQTEFVDVPEAQKQMLRQKDCPCFRKQKSPSEENENRSNE